MIEDLQADSVRWNEELNRSRNRGSRQPGKFLRPRLGYGMKSDVVAVYEGTYASERRQVTSPNQNPTGYPGGRTRQRDDYDMDDYGRPGPPSARSLFQSMSQDYPQNYSVTSGAFQGPAMTAPLDYVHARGQAESYGQVPRSEHDMYPANAGRGTAPQSAPPGQFAAPQGLQNPAPYQDPRTGQMIYPPSAGGRGFEPSPRHTGATDGRRR